MRVPKFLRDRSGFTLIELMIVVAIIGILASIAIPNFIKFQLRSKASEGRLNLAGIRTAQSAHFAEVGVYTQWSATPSVLPGQARAPWGAAFCAQPPASGDPGYCFIGFAPEGDVYFQYESATNGVSTSSGAQYWAVARSDIDGDGNDNMWGITVPDVSGGTLATGGLGCTAVLNPMDGVAMLSQVGPCNDKGMGRHVF